MARRVVRVLLPTRARAFAALPSRLVFLPSLLSARASVVADARALLAGVGRASRERRDREALARSAAVGARCARRGRFRELFWRRCACGA
eukprot:31439-Pelagococcus_subviridis.AAC.4